MPFFSYRLPFALLAALAVSACSQRDLMLFNYIEASHSAAIDERIEATSITRVMEELEQIPGNDICVLSAERTATGGFQDGIAGQPGQSGFNVSVTAIRPINRVTVNPPGCESITSFQLVVGGPGTPLGLRQPTDQGVIEVVIDGDTYTTNASSSSTGRLFEGRVNSFNAGRGSFQAGFEAVAVSPANRPGRMVLLDGAVTIR
ncbi:MAG: hypothetical protein AAFX00_03185 [Pseudomonadota bacterium]